VEEYYPEKKLVSGSDWNLREAMIAAAKSGANDILRFMIAKKVIAKGVFSTCCKHGNLGELFFFFAKEFYRKTKLFFFVGTYFRFKKRDAKFSGMKLRSLMIIL
jgi:hypothetical protein